MYRNLSIHNNIMCYKYSHVQVEHTSCWHCHGWWEWDILCHSPHLHFSTAEIIAYTHHMHNCPTTIPPLHIVHTNIIRINTYWAAVKMWVEFVAIALIGESWAFISPRREQEDSDHIFKDPLRHTLNSNGWSGTTANPHIQSLWALFID